MYIDNSIMNIHDYILNNNHFITSDKIHQFIQKIDIPSVQYIKMDFIKQRNGFIISMNGWRDRNELIDLNSVEILVTGHSDYSVDEAELPILNLPQLKCWFCANKNIEHPKLHSIPLGITNKDEPVTRGRHKIIGNTDRIYEIAQNIPEYIPTKLAYLNICVTNYTYERARIIELFVNKQWITHEVPEITESGHHNFLCKVHNHKFTISPRGNGLDTHRLWESLYLGTIPIVKKHLSMKDFEDLPILFVDEWADVTEEFLKEQYDLMMKKKYNMNKITMTYWCDKICDLVEGYNLKK